MSLTEEIKNKVTVLDLVSEFVDLKKQGRLFKSVCPFHSENTPSFIVDPDKNMWRCFGACSTGGDVISFIMKKDSISFLDSLNFLCFKSFLCKSIVVFIPSITNSSRDRSIL